MCRTLEMTERACGRRSGESDRNAVERLLSQIDIVYPVALSYTGDPLKARSLTHGTLQQAWTDGTALADDRSLKSQLLTSLRVRYMRSHADEN